MRIAIVYDCLYPHTIGGAERWYRHLAERLSGSHEVTYVTRRQWPAGESPGTPFGVVAVSSGGPLYTESGRRRALPPLRFGIGVFWHLLRKGRHYDVVHSASFPYFSVIGAWLALRIRRRARLVVDWHELWTWSYWREYLGPLGGAIGYGVQRLCVRMPDQSFTFSRLHARRLAAEGHRADITRLTGEYAGDSSVDGAEASDVAGQDPLAVFAGRHIREKGVAGIPDALAAARRRLPSIRALVFGDGPERPVVERRVRELGLQEAVDLPGPVSAREVHQALARASCLLFPSRREGYGLVVIEALAQGTPAVVVAGPDNAATELIEHGVNGMIVADDSPERIADALVAVVEAGEELRRSTREWYRAHADELSLDSSLATVEAVYRELARRA